MTSGLFFDEEGRDITMDVLSAAVEDGHPGPWLNPDCWNGKHQACAGDAWNGMTDEPSPCQCTCHRTTDVPVGSYL
jgi:hypothetical protein